MPQNLTQNVRNQSSRNGARPKIAVLHTTEGHNRPGVSDLTGLAGWFDNPAAQASSHLGIDQEGNCIRMVPDDAKAWTQASFNPQALAIEQVGFSATSKQQWVKDYHRGLYRVAVALARWHKAYGIPLKHSTSFGVCQHKNLGLAGGGHHDCGPGYPERYVTWWARLVYYRISGRRKSARARMYKAFVAGVQRRHGFKKSDTQPWEA